MLKYFRIPFGNTGDRAAVPDAADPSGYVSYTAGYTFDYQRDLATDPAAKPIERDKANQLWFDVTTAIGEIQSQGVPDYITSALNGGSPYSYAANAIARYSGDVYLSLAGSNTALPSDPTKWTTLPTPRRIQGSTYSVATTGGSSDAITGALLPAVTAFPAAPGTLTVWVRAGNANTTATPTFALDGLAAKTIVKGNNLALVAGDISGAGHWLNLQYDATLDKWVLINPATGVSDATPDASTSTKGKVQLATSAEAQALSDALKALTPATLAAAFQGANQSLGASGYQKLPGGFILQWGFKSGNAAGFSVVFPTAFPVACYGVWGQNALYSSSAYSTLALTGAPGTTGFSGFMNSTGSAHVADDLFWFAVGK